MTARGRRGGSRRCIATAPLRVDLAGGTLDLWPLGLLHAGGVTVATAVTLRVSAEVGAPPAKGAALVRSRDQGREERFRLAGARGRPGPLNLLRRVVIEVAPPEGLTLTSFSPIPAGSGLGASSALGVAAAAAALRWRGVTPLRDRVIPLVRDLEAQVLGIPTGTQDHEAAWRGGLVFLEHRPGGPRVSREAGGRLRALGERLVLVDSGQARSSGPSNWDMFRRRIAAEEDALRALTRVAKAGAKAADALLRCDWRTLGRAMREDLEARQDWSPLVLTEGLIGVFAAAESAGALGFKVCGAGGGGFAVVLVAPDARKRLVQSLGEAGARVVDAGPTGVGLRFSRPV